MLSYTEYKAIVEVEYNDYLITKVVTTNAQIAYRQASRVDRSIEYNNFMIMFMKICKFLEFIPHHLKDKFLSLLTKLICISDEYTKRICR